MEKDPRKKTKRDDRNKKMPKNNRKRAKKAALCAALGLAAVLGTVMLAAWAEGADTASAILSLNYEEAAKGLNPDSTRFDVYWLKSDEVLGRAIKEMGLEGKLGAEELAGGISISPQSAKGSGEYFIPTSFNIQYSQKEAAGGLGADEVLGAICTAYSGAFQEEYGGSGAALQCGDVTYESFGDMEYAEAAKKLEQWANRAGRYLSMRASENGTFALDDGTTFQSANQLVENLKEYDIANFKSFVLQSGVAKDGRGYAKALGYQNSTLGLQYKKHMADYTARQEGIAYYDEAMIGTVMIPTIGDGDEFYMARANIGIDYLAQEADYHLTSANDTQKKITQNEDTAAKLGDGAASSEDVGKAERMLKAICQKCLEISGKAVEIDSAYTKHKMKNYITFLVQG